MPCLVFNKVLLSIDSSDLKTIGVLLLTAILYQVVGLFFSLTTRAVTPNPKYWVGGLLIAGIFTNSGDLPIAYISTLSSGTLFTAHDANKGIAYCVIFLTIFIFTMFNLGCFRLVQRDFTRKVRDIENGLYDPEKDPAAGLQRLFVYSKQKFIGWFSGKKPVHEVNVGVEIPLQTTQPNLERQATIDSSSSGEPEPIPLVESHKSLGLSKIDSNASGRSSMARLRPVASIAQKTVPGLGTLADDSDEDQESSLAPQPSENIKDVINAYAQQGKLNRVSSRSSYSAPDEETPKTTDDELSADMNILQKVATTSSVVITKMHKIKQKAHSNKKRFLAFIHKYHLTMLWEFIKNFSQPPSAALITAIIFTMIPPVRRLFYAASDSTVQNIPDAPDGGPVLGFVMDFTSFVGNATVPLGLCMLGATMSRLGIGKLPRGFWKSILLMAVFKLVVLPIIAIAWTQKMKQLNWISPDNYMAIFVMIISSGVPTATSQVYLTAIYMPPDVDSKEMDCLAAYLIFQYILLVFSMTILLTYTLKNVIGF